MENVWLRPTAASAGRGQPLLLTWSKSPKVLAVEESGSGSFYGSAPTNLSWKGPLVHQANWSTNHMEV